MREPALGSDGPLAEESGVWEADTAKEPVAFSSVMPDGSVLGPVRRFMRSYGISESKRQTPRSRIFSSKRSWHFISTSMKYSASPCVWATSSQAL